MNSAMKRLLCALSLLLAFACASKDEAPRPAETAAVQAPAAPPPLAITLSSPGGEGSLDVETLMVTGRVSDPAATVTVQVNGNSAAVVRYADGWFTATTRVPPGDGTATVNASAADGRTAERTVRYRTVPPDRAIIGEFAPEPVPVTEPVRELRGTVAAGVKSLAINGEDVPLDRGRFSRIVSLKPDVPSVFRLEALTSSGIPYERTVVWVLDNTPPVVTIDGIPETTNSSELTLSITASEPLDRLELTGEPVPYHHGEPSKAKIRLFPGKNEIAVVATDLAGHTVSVIRTVRFDRTPPKPLPVTLPVAADTVPPELELFDPPDSETVLSTFRITGRTETASTVTVNGARAQSFAGLFSAELTLPAGKQILKTEAIDAAGNRTAKEFTLEVNDDRKLFLRNTGKTAERAYSPNVQIREPADGRLYGSTTPFRISLSGSKSLSVFLNGEPLLAEAAIPIPAGQKDPKDPVTELADALPSGSFHEGRNSLDVLVDGMNGEQLHFTRMFNVDRTPPVIEIQNLIDGERVSAYLPKAAITDASETKLTWALDGKPLENSRQISAKTDGTGPKTLCADAKDPAGNSSEVCLAVILDPAPLVVRRGSDPRPTAQSPLKHDLLQPALADLMENGLLADLLIGNLMLLGDASGVFYPEFDLEPLKLSLAEQARTGELAELLKGVAQFRRRGWWEDAEQLFGRITAPGPKGRIPLAHLASALDGFTPRTAHETMALDRLLSSELSPGITPLDLPGRFLEELAKADDGVWSELWSFAARGSRSGFVTALDDLGQALARPDTTGHTAFERMEPVWTNLLGTDRTAPVGLIFDTYLEAVARIPEARDREAFRKLTETIIQIVLDPGTIRAFGRALDSPYLEQNQEWIRRSIERGDFNHLFRTLAAASLEPNPRDPSEPVLVPSLKALAKLWQPDRRSPERTYAASAAVAVGELLQTGNDNQSTVADFLKFFESLNENDRKILGRIFWQSSRKEGRPLDPFRENASTDAERLMRLFTIANSPLNCGAPVPFTNKVVPLNVPGLPQLFPTDNLVTELFEASTFFDADTVIQLARLMPKFVQILRMGDMFCEPEIVKDLLSDADVIEANLNNPLLPDLLRMGRRVVLRKQHHAAVRLLTVFSDSGVLPQAIPFLATLYRTDGAEELYQFMVRQKTWRLESGDKPVAFEHSLRAGAIFLGLDRDRVVPGAALVDRFTPMFGAATLASLQKGTLHILKRTVAGETRPGLGRLDLVFGRLLAADPDAEGVKVLAALTDGDPSNGDLVAVIREMPVREKPGSHFIDSLPDLAVQFDRNGLADAGMELGRQYLQINRRSAGGLRWILKNSFTPGGTYQETPLLATYSSLGPVLDLIGTKRTVWRAWAGAGDDRPLRPLLKSVRSWTRSRDSGPPHLMRVRDLIARSAMLPAPDGRGLMVEKLSLLLDKARERGLARSVGDTLELLDSRGYLDSTRPSIIQWIGTAAAQ